MDTHKNEPAGGSCWTALGNGVQAMEPCFNLQSPASKPQCCDQAMSLIGPYRILCGVRSYAAVWG